MTCAPTATRTRDLPLRRSFVCSRLNAAMLARPRLLVVLVLLDVARFGSLWARGGHAVRVMRQETRADERNRTVDLLLTMSIPGRDLTAAMLVRAGLVVVLAPINVSRFCSILARGWHAPPPVRLALPQIHSAFLSC